MSDDELQQIEDEELEQQEIKEEDGPNYDSPFNQKYAPIKEEETKIDVSDSVANAQEKILSGLSDTMSTLTLENMQTLAPRDRFDISVNGRDKTFDRKKLTPKQLKDLRTREREYAEEYRKLTDPDLKLDREQQMLCYKAGLYLGMTESEFEECDVEYLTQVIQATELRTQGFRKCQ